jgi:acyl dehydratase
MKLDVLRQYNFPTVEYSYTERDSIIYALGLGYGADALSPAHLQFLYEQGNLKAVPSMSVILGHTGFWARDPVFDIDWVKLLHAEQSFELHRPLAPAGTITAEFSILGVDDKGADKGAMVYQQRRVRDAASGELVATVNSTLFMRGDGGCGGYGEIEPAPGALPETAPDCVVDIPTLPQAALIYRLSGDWNPIHADPETARKAGFERPILHGLCTMGVACRALLQGCADDQPERLRSMFVRFSRPVFPGETIRVEFYREGSTVRFRARSLERNVVVLDRGHARLE